MVESDAKVRCETNFAQAFGNSPLLTASAPGRIEVLGNHTDYNLGLTLSCAIGQRCYAAIAPLDQPEVRLASTSIGGKPSVFQIGDLETDSHHWTAYVLGLIVALRERGQMVPGFAMLIDSDVPRSAGLSSSAALQMAALTAIAGLTKLELSVIEQARIGQYVESAIVGAHTGLLDQLSSLLGKRDHLIEIDHRTMATSQHPMPAGWCFIVVDSGVKHDLTQAYNDRRRSCEDAASVLGLASLRDATLAMIETNRGAMRDDAYRCARHVIAENQRVSEAIAALRRGDIETLGQLMFASHQSSREYFHNSCKELDDLVQYGHDDPRCFGARLSGGGFGGVTIHLVRECDAQAYLGEVVSALHSPSGSQRWGAICRIGDGAG